MIAPTFNKVSQRLILRSFTPQDYPAYRQMVFARDRENLPAEKLEKQARLGFERELKVMAANEALWLGGFDRQAPEQLALELELSPSLTLYRTWDLRYQTLPSYREQGYMREALAAVLPEMPALGIKHIFALVRNENDASIRTVEGAGFVEKQPRVLDLHCRHFHLRMA